MTHPNHLPKKPKYGFKSLVEEALNPDYQPTQEVNTMSKPEKSSNPIKEFVQGLFSKASALVENPQPIKVAKTINSFDYQETSTADIEVAEHVKSLATQKIVELRVEQVRFNQQVEADIQAIVQETQTELVSLGHASADSLKNKEFSWATLDGLQVISCQKSEYAVPNEGFFIAKEEFNAMLAKHNHDVKDPFVNLSVLAFELTAGGRVNTKAIRDLRKSKFDYPEWQVIKGRLSDCWDYRVRKMTVLAKVRQSLMHRLMTVTENWKGFESSEAVSQ
jgi:hypothetical protein